MTDTKLLPCPFCGGNAETDICDRGREWAQCAQCFSRAESVAAWNRRAHPDLRAGWVCPETYMLTLEAVQTEAKRVAELSAEVEAKQRVAFQAQEMAREIASKLAAAEKEVERLREAAKALAIQWRHNAQGCGRKDQHAAGTWRSCARDIEAAMNSGSEKE